MLAEAPEQIADWDAIDRVLGALEQALRTAGNFDEEIEAELSSLVTPYEVLDRLSGLATRVRSSSSQASAELAQRLDELRRMRSQLLDAPHSLHDEPRVEGSSAAPQPALVTSLLDFDTYADLVGCVLNLHGNHLDKDAGAFLRLIHAVVAQASPLERLHEAFMLRGQAGLLEEFRWLALLREPTKVALEMRSLQGNLSWPTTLSGFPGGPLPLPFPLPIPRPSGPTSPPRKWRPPRPPNDPWVPWSPWRPFGAWFDTRGLRCASALGKLIAAQGTEPARPATVVWWDNISSVTSEDPCATAGVDLAPVVIRGHGFGAVKPASVGLMLMMKGVCTAEDIDAITWTDEEITFRAPWDMTSGPVGFVDLDYVKAYDAWVDACNGATGQLNAMGCGRGVDLHLREHFHECPASTPFNNIVLGSAFILSFEVNGQSLCLLEPDEAIVLSWNAVNATEVRLQRVSANAPLFNGQLEVAGLPSVGTFFISATGHTQASIWEYQLFAIGPCQSSTRSAKVIATKRPKLYVDKIEVTQGIQTSTQSVRLVKHKATVVRTTVRHQLNGWGQNEVNSVRGRLRALGPGWESPWIDAANVDAAAPQSPMAPNPGSQITVVSNPDETITNHTLNFLLPTSWCEDSRRFEIEVRVANFGAVGTFPGFSEVVSSMSYYVTFLPRKKLRLRYARIAYGDIPAPSDEEVRTLLNAAMLRHPTPRATLVPMGSGSVPWSDAMTIGAHLAREDGAHFLWEVLGPDPHPADETGEFWIFVTGHPLGGKAATTPGRTCQTSMSPPSAAHEIAHLLGQYHLTALFCGLRDDQQPDFATAAENWPLGGRLGGVAYDISLNRTVGGMFEAADLMTYCHLGGRFRWTSAHRWDQLWDRIG